jgi:hypothetical protein
LVSRRAVRDNAEAQRVLLKPMRICERVREIGVGLVDVRGEPRVRKLLKSPAILFVRNVGALGLLLKERALRRGDARLVPRTEVRRLKT